jgi:hypothetical protein
MFFNLNINLKCFYTLSARRKCLIFLRILSINQEFSILYSLTILIKLLDAYVL